jgi:hypothetical protein
MPDGGVAVISAGFWRSHFASDPKVLGRQLRLNQILFTIVGVMPESFRGMDHDQHPDVFIPLESEPLVDAPFNGIALDIGSGGYWSVPASKKVFPLNKRRHS